MSSPYPNWDPPAGAGWVLDEGHETLASTVLDAHVDEVLEMPSESPWPIVLALCAALVAVFVLTSHYAIAGVFAVGMLLVLAAWHSQEPEAAA